MSILLIPTNFQINRKKDDIDIFIQTYIDMFSRENLTENMTNQFIEDFIFNLSMLSINKIIEEHGTLEIYQNLINQYINVYDKIEYIDYNTKYMIEDINDDIIKINITKLILKDMIDSIEILF